MSIDKSLVKLRQDLSTVLDTLTSVFLFRGDCSVKLRYMRRGSNVSGLSEKLTE